MRLCASLLRLLKSLFYIALLWALLVLVWLVLPSPVPTDGHTIRAIESGHTAHLIYDINGFAKAVGLKANTLVIIKQLVQVHFFIKIGPLDRDCKFWHRF